MEYIEVLIELSPYTEESGEIAIALLDSLPFDTFQLEEPYLKGYLSKDLFDEQLLREVMEREGEGLPFSWRYSYTVTPKENWNRLWESNFSPILIGDRCLVKASFHKDLPEAKYSITIDPKMAFGTGHHQTTSLVLEGLLDQEVEGKSVLDMGCGTGILAILAAMMGASEVKGVDIDPDAVASTIENSEKNGVAEIIKAVEGGEEEIEEGKYDIILANITRNVILQQLQHYRLGLKSGGLLLLSGFYLDDHHIIREEGEKEQFSFLELREKGEWASLILKKV